MARKQRKQKRQARRQALQGAAAAAAPTTPAAPTEPPAAPATPSAAPPTPAAAAPPATAASASAATSVDDTKPFRVVRTPPPAAAPLDRTVDRAPAASAAGDPRGTRTRRPGAVWPLVGVAAAAVFGLAVLVALALNGDGNQAAVSPSQTIVVGVPGGEVTSVETPAPSPTPAPTATPTTEPTPEPTAEPTTAATPRATPVVTPAPQPAAPAPTAPPDPTPVIVAMAQPDDAVAAFYANVTDGDFDAAYALWSDRMKATYPRQENLDERFDDTASITFHQLEVVQQGDGTAVVQANFTETYDGGGSRDFIGYWELIRDEGRWLLDAPHY